MTRNALNAEYLSVADMLANGADTVAGSCEDCGHLWRAPILILPPATTLAKLRAIMQCPKCESVNVEIIPKWPDAEPVNH